MSIAIVTATQCEGLILMHEKMFESRLFFVDKLIAMAPGSCFVIRPCAVSDLRGFAARRSTLRHTRRNGILIAALCAEGRSGDQQRGPDRARLRANRSPAERARSLGRASGRPAEVTAAPQSIPREDVESFASFGIRAFTTRREAGTFSLSSDAPVGEVMARWTSLQEDLADRARRCVIGRQVHGTTVVTHRGGWEGLLRTGEADGHIAAERGIILTVSVADWSDLQAHPSGIVGILHSGWRGTSARIIDGGLNAFARLGLAPDEIKVHLGPSICGRCYEVSADVREQLTGQPVNRGGNVDLRSLIQSSDRGGSQEDGHLTAQVRQRTHFSHARELVGSLGDRRGDPVGPTHPELRLRSVGRHPLFWVPRTGNLCSGSRSSPLTL